MWGLSTGARSVASESKARTKRKGCTLLGAHIQATHLQVSMRTVEQTLTVFGTVGDLGLFDFLLHYTHLFFVVIHALRELIALWP
jgi:hypothetical protein